MLAFPLKRLSIYRDLIQSICQATQPSHPDYHNLMRAQDMINAISGELRMERMIAHDQLALWDIQSNMVALPEPIMIPARRLLLRADLHKVDSALALEPRTYYLMNDVLIYARFDPKKNVYAFKVRRPLSQPCTKPLYDKESVCILTLVLLCLRVCVGHVRLGEDTDQQP